MIKQNKKITTVHLDGKQEEKICALKELLSTPEDELFDSTKFNFSNAGLKYKVFNRKDIDISKSEESVKNSVSATISNT